jgi:hypothetical protein
MLFNLSSPLPFPRDNVDVRTRVFTLFYVLGFILCTPTFFIALSHYETPKPQKNSCGTVVVLSSVLSLAHFHGFFLHCFLKQKKKLKKCVP